METEADRALHRYFQYLQCAPVCSSVLQCCHVIEASDMAASNEDLRDGCAPAAICHFQPRAPSEWIRISIVMNQPSFSGSSGSIFDTIARMSFIECASSCPRRRKRGHIRMRLVHARKQPLLIRQPKT